MRHESNIVIFSEVVLDFSRIKLKAADDVLLLKLQNVFDFSSTWRGEDKMMGNAVKSTFNIDRANKSLTISHKKVTPKYLAMKTENLKLLSKVAELEKNKTKDVVKIISPRRKK